MSTPTDTQAQLRYDETFLQSSIERERETTVAVLEDGRVSIEQSWDRSDRDDVVVLSQKAVDDLLDELLESSEQEPEEREVGA
jgi:hypothetical protein